MSNFTLGPEEGKALQGVAEIIAEESAVVLSTLLDKKIDINVQGSGPAEPISLGWSFPEEIVVVECPFASGFDAVNYFLFNKPLVAKLSDLMMMWDGTAEFTEDHIDAVQEGVNQMMGAAATALSARLNKSVDFQPSMARVASLSESGLDFEQLTVADLVLLIEGKPEGPISVLIKYEVIKECTSAMGANAPVEEGAGAGMREEMGADLGSMDSAVPQGGPRMDLERGFDTEMASRPSYFEGSDLNKAERERLELLLDIKLDVSIELGRSKMLLRDILELGPGAVIELDKMAGETVDLLINDKKLAEGEVVVVDENFGVRITHLISMEERIKMLQSA
jgi:flagellar motor switch protein FliN